MAERHLAIVEVSLEDIASLLGLPAEFVFCGAMLGDEKLRLKFSHPSFPLKVEGENITILPYLKGASVGRPNNQG